MGASAQINIVPNGPNVSAPSDIVSLIQGSVGQWITTMQSYVYEIFWALAFLDIAWWGIDSFLKYRQNVSLMVISAANKIMVIGLFLALVANSAQWIPALVNTFPQIGRQAAGVSAITASAIMMTGLNMSESMLGAAAHASLFLDVPAALAFIVAALGILLAFAFLTINVIVAIIETMLAIGVGYIFVGFGGSRWTSNFVERYFSYAIAAGIKLMAIYMFVGLGVNATANWAAQVKNINPTTLSFGLAWEILSGVLVYVGVCWMVPKKVAGILGGSPTLGASDGVGMIAAALTAGAAAASVASGIGSLAVGAGAAGAAGAGAAGATGAGVGQAGVGAVAPMATASTAAAPVQPVAPVAASATGMNGASGAPKQPSAPGGGLGKIAAQASNGVVSTINKMPHNGGGGSGPKLGGFSHE